MAQNVTQTRGIINTASNNQGNATEILNTVWWMKVVLGVEICLTDAFRHILHNYDNDSTYTGLTDDEVQLYNQMITFKNTYKNKLCKIIREDQWNILCPPSGRSDSSTWDITLLIVVIRYCTDLPSPQGGWEQKSPKRSDTSKAAFVLRSRKYRNDVKHGSIHDISTKAQFTVYWVKMESLLKGLNYTNMTLFYHLETGTLKMYTKQMVKALEEKIADVEDHNESEINILKNHLCILKTEFDNKLKKIENDVDILKSKSVTLLPANGIYWNVYQNVHNFVDRKETFLKIESIFSSPNQTCDHITVVIHGLGGVGKTEVAANYAKCHKALYDNIIWLDCENIQDSVKELFTSYCSNNGQSSVTAYLNAIYTTLNHTKCLFILDNIQDYQDTTDFFKGVGSFKYKPHFLITTQRSCRVKCEFQTVDLSVFSKQESILFIQEAFPLEERETIEELVHTLESFPLALQQARAYIQKDEKMTIAKYIKYFNEHNRKLLNINLKEMVCTQYSKTLLTVWSLAFQKIRSDEASLAILGIMAYMDGKRINKNTFLYHQFINQDEIKLNEVIDILTEYSLIQVRNTEKYTILSMHTLVQDILKINGLQNDADYLSQTVDLLQYIKRSSNHKDLINLWYVHAKFIFLQIDEIKNVNAYPLARSSMCVAFNHLDFNFANHLVFLCSRSISSHENIDVSIIFKVFNDAAEYFIERQEFKGCKQVLNSFYQLLNSFPHSKRHTIMYYLSCLGYFFGIKDVQNIKHSYSMLKDLTFFPFNADVICDPFMYLQMLAYLRKDHSGCQILAKEKTGFSDFNSLINEPIQVLGPVLDTYGYESNVARLYFRCVLFKIELEIDDGNDKEEDIKLFKDSIKSHSLLDLNTRKYVTYLQVLNYMRMEKYEKSLDILYKAKNTLLKEHEISSPFQDYKSNMSILITDCNTATIMLKYGKYKEAREILTTLLEHQILPTSFCHHIKLNRTIAKVMCNEFEDAIEIINKIPQQWLQREASGFMELNLYLCCYKIKHRELNVQRGLAPYNKVKVELLLKECIDVKRNIFMLCQHIIKLVSLFSPR